jgi:plastocyanin
VTPARVVLVVALLSLVLAAPASPAAAPKKLTASVGPGFTISLKAKSVKAGTYRIVVSDKSEIHNFHLTGPGVNKSTSVEFTGTQTWTVKLKKGTYRYVCDPHSTSMNGSLKVT